MAIWEDLVSLHSSLEPALDKLPTAAELEAADTRKADFADMGDYREDVAKDTFPIPHTQDREGYYGDQHFSYWLSGLRDARMLIDVANEFNSGTETFLDLGCASGRVIRHLAYDDPSRQVYGCDINRSHVEWCNAYLPKNVAVFHNSSVPSIQLPDNSVDIVSSYSVFTHIEAFETAWLAEIRRVLKPGGIAWITVHTEHTLEDMTPDWPLWKPIMDHPDIGTMLDENRQFSTDRLVVRWREDRSYSSNIFYKKDYIERHWSRFFEIAAFRRRYPEFQDVYILRKPA